MYVCMDAIPEETLPSLVTRYCSPAVVTTSHLIPCSGSLAYWTHFPTVVMSYGDKLGLAGQTTAVDANTAHDSLSLSLQNCHITVHSSPTPHMPYIYIPQPTPHSLVNQTSPIHRPFIRVITWLQMAGGRVGLVQETTHPTLTPTVLTYPGSVIHCQ